MVPINLAPESVVVAKRRRSFAEWIVALLISTALLVVTGICSLAVESTLSNQDSEQEEILTREMRALRDQLKEGQHRVKLAQTRSQMFDSLTKTRLRVVSGLKLISEVIATRVSLFSVRISESQIQLAGVASSRAVVGEVVNALKGKATVSEVVIESLKEASIDRQILEEFEVRARENRDEKVD
jgi:Tfp pilus assembly protein PilN